MKLSRNTVARTEILARIAASPVALSHLELQDKLNGLCDRVTIYRVLERLVESGEIHKVVNTDGVLKYASCRKCEGVHHHSHAHFSCVRCHTVRCLHGVEPAFQLPAGYKSEAVNFTVSGLCPSCC